MYVKLLLRNLNHSPYPPHSANIYTYEVIILPRVRDASYISFENTFKSYLGHVW